MFDFLSKLRKTPKVDCFQSLRRKLEENSAQLHLPISRLGWVRVLEEFGDPLEWVVFGGREFTTVTWQNYLTLAGLVNHVTMHHH
jgi:hypothetical protein